MFERGRLLPITRKSTDDLAFHNERLTPKCEILCFGLHPFLRSHRLPPHPLINKHCQSAPSSLNFKTPHFPPARRPTFGPDGEGAGKTLSAAGVFVLPFVRGMHLGNGLFPERQGAFGPTFGFVEGPAGCDFGGRKSSLTVEMPLGVEVSEKLGCSRQFFSSSMIRFCRDSWASLARASASWASALAASVSEVTKLHSLLRLLRDFVADNSKSFPSQLSAS